MPTRQRELPPVQSCIVTTAKSEMTESDGTTHVAAIDAVPPTGAFAAYRRIATLRTPMC